MKMRQIWFLVACFWGFGLLADSQPRIAVERLGRETVQVGDCLAFRVMTRVATVGVRWSVCGAGLSDGGQVAQRNAGQSFVFEFRPVVTGEVSFTARMCDAQGNDWPCEEDGAVMPPVAACAMVGPALPDAALGAWRDGRGLEGKVADGRLVFRCGEPIRFKFRAGKGAEVVLARTGDDGREQTERIAATGGWQDYVTYQAQPGCVRVALAAEGKTLVLGAMVEPESLRVSDTRPSDFGAFWTARRARVEAACGQPVFHGEGRGRWVEIPCGEEMPATGRLFVPDAARAGTCPIVVGFTGYNPTAIDGGIAPRPDAIVFSFNTHGTRPWETGFNAVDWANAHSLWNYGFDAKTNGDVETAYMKGVLCRIIAVVSFLKTLPAWDGKTLVMSGGSQGGYLALMGAAICQETTAVEAVHPWLCDLDSALVGRRGGWHPRWTNALAYLSPTSAAPDIRAKVSLTAGLADDTCSPAGIIAVYNALTCPKTLTVAQGQTHTGSVPNPELVLTLSQFWK